MAGAGQRPANKSELFYKGPWQSNHVAGVWKMESKTAARCETAAVNRLPDSNSQTLDLPARSAQE